MLKIKKMATTPIKRNQHIVQLSKDHHFTLLFCWKIRQGIKMQIESERQKNYIRYFFKEHMEPHFQNEEKLLFNQTSDEKVRKALDDHREIRNHIEKVLQSPNENSSGLLSMLADIVEAHVRYEERELFPHLENVLTDDQLQFIGEELSKEEIKPDDYEDEFWIRNKH